MSLKFYKTRYLSEHTYDNLIDVFDPRINSLWSGDTLVVRDWLRMMEKLYSRDNLRQYLRMLQNGSSRLGMSSTNENLFNTYYYEVPDHQLWVLHFMVVERKISSTETRFNCYQPTDTPSTMVTNRGFAIRPYDADYKQVMISDIPALVNTMYTKWMAHFQGFLDHTWSIDHSTNMDNPFISQLYGFIKGTTTYGNDMGRSFNITQVVASTRVKLSFTIGNETAIANGEYFNLMGREILDNENRRPLYNVLAYSTNPCNLLSWPKVEQGEINPTLYGVELECAFDYEVKDIIDAQHDLFFIAKQDSSVNGRKKTRAELVTVPMSLKAHKKYWAAWFQKLDYKRFDCTTDTNNGMHVHIDKKALDDDKHLRNMVWFYAHPANTEFIVAFSERGSLAKMQSYTPIPNFGSLTKVKAYRRCVDIASRHRGIVNVSTNKPTVEIRMFRGVVSFAEMLKNLEFVDAVLNFTRGEHSPNSLSLVHFLKWLEATPRNRYTMVKAFIQQMKKLDQTIASCELYNIIFSETDPDTIVAALNKSNLSITNAHVSLLNKGKKRTFVLNKMTGRLEITESKLSKLAKLDRNIEAIYTRQLAAA